MKKKLPLLLLSFCFSVMLVSAQQTATPYIIKFKDKGSSKYTLAKPGDYLSQRSIERRLLQSIPLDQTDLPVSPSYLQSLKDEGVEIFYKSKWLNIVMANLNPDQVNMVKGLPFVVSASPTTALVQKKNSFFKKFIQHEKVQKLDESKIKSSYKSTMLDYGAAANQAQMLKIDEIHDLGYTGHGMTIAVIDAGYNSADEMDAFDSLFMNNRILAVHDFVQPGNDIYNPDISTHGTMVLSTMGANLPGQMIGTAPHASYYLLRSEDATAEYLMEEYYWVTAAEYADSAGVDVINTSLGYTTFDNAADNHTYQDMNGDTAPITIGADLAAKKGMLVVNSAGNEGNNEWIYISAPADGDSVLTVGAVTDMGDYAYFSSRGPTADGRIKPDVAAQGQGSIVASPWGISMANGTSFSSPIMSGAAACFWQANPTYSNMEIISFIKQSGSLANNPDNLIGWGIPDFVKANALTASNSLPQAKTIFYPNPFTEYINIDIEDTLNSPVRIKLMDASGRVIREYVMDKTNKGVKIDGLGDLRSGIYFIQVNYNNSTYNYKMVK
jgi:hypothetical protein